MCAALTWRRSSYSAMKSSLRTITEHLFAVARLHALDERVAQGGSLRCWCLRSAAGQRVTPRPDACMGPLQVTNTNNFNTINVNTPLANGQTAAEVSARNPESNVFRPNVQTAASNPSAHSPSNVLPRTLPHHDVPQKQHMHWHHLHAYYHRAAQIVWTAVHLARCGLLG